MGEAQSKSQSNKTEKQEKNQEKIQEKLSSSSSQSKPKNYKKIQTCINVDQFQKMLSREDPILDQEQIKQLQQKQEQEQQEQQQQENFNVQDFINFKLVPRQNPVKLSNKEKTTVPVMISMETQAASEELPSNRSPIDLVCVIDDSGSMSGTKAKLVRKSLKYLLKILNDKDRICLITYDNNAKVLTPFLRNSENNKQELKNAIQNVQGRGGTQTITGIEHGLWMMKNRKQKNPVTCMFLLSDGVDFQGKQLSDNVASLIYDYQIKEQFTINTYGYGADHDPDVLLNIAKQKGGNFYFIENLKKVSDWFILSLSGLLTVLGEDIQIRLKQQKNVDIIKGYGDEKLWDSDFIIHLAHLLQGDKKEYLLELALPKLKQNLKDEEKQRVILACELIGTALSGKSKEIYIKTELQITQLNPEENVNQIEQNEKFEVAYLRAKGGEIIGQACSLSDKGKYEEAQKILSEFLEQIELSQFKEAQGIQFIKQDVLKSKDKCKPHVFQHEGKAFMYKKQKDHIERQASLCNLEDWNGNQKQMFDEYEKGNYNLSDDSCSDNDDNDNDHNNNSFCSNNSIQFQQQQQQTQKVQQNIRRRSSIQKYHQNSRSLYSSGCEESDSDSA